MSELKKTLDRRSVVKAAAWSVPAVTVASAAPAFATSFTSDITDPGVFIRWSDDSAKLLRLGLLDGQDVLDLELLPTGPRHLEVINNTNAPLTGVQVTLNVAVDRQGLLEALGDLLNIGRVPAYQVRSATGFTVSPPTVTNETLGLVGGILGLVGLGEALGSADKVVQVLTLSHTIPARGAWRGDVVFQETAPGLLNVKVASNHALTLTAPSATVGAAAHIRKLANVGVLGG